MKYEMLFKFGCYVPAFIAKKTFIICKLMPNGRYYLTLFGFVNSFVSLTVWVMTLKLDKTWKRN